MFSNVVLPILGTSMKSHNGSPLSNYRFDSSLYCRGWLKVYVKEDQGEAGFDVDSQLSHGSDKGPGLVTLQLHTSSEQMAHIHSRTLRIRHYTRALYRISTHVYQLGK